MRILSIAAILATAACLPASAWASGGTWTRLGTTAGSDYLTAFAAPTDQDLFCGGLNADMSSGLPKIAPVLYASHDGGTVWKPALGAIGASMNPLNAKAIAGLDFLDAKTGWAVVADGVWRTTDGAVTWNSAKLSSEGSAIHFADAKTGIVVGKGGAIFRSTDGGGTWTDIPSPTQVDLSRLFAVDAKHWFAAGGTQIDSTDPNEPSKTLTTFGDGAVLLSSDGGATWKAGYTTTGKVLGPLFFVDAKTGFLALSDWDSSVGRAGPAQLLQSIDGGLTFQPIALDPKVGTLKFVMDVPIQLSYVTAMTWNNAENGHLGGSAYVSDQSSGGSSSSPPIYRTVDFLTHDGGKTWQKTDLGVVTMSLSRGGSPTDGRTMAGAFRSFWRGWLVGETGAVFSSEITCSSKQDCPGGTCGPLQQCMEAGGSTGSKDAGGSGADSTGKDASAGSDTGTLQGADALSTGVVGGAGGKAISGCGAGRGGSAGWGVAFGVLAMALLRRRFAR